MLTKDELLKIDNVADIPVEVLPEIPKRGIIKSIGNCKIKWINIIDDFVEPYSDEIAVNFNIIKNEKALLNFESSINWEGERWMKLRHFTPDGDLYHTSIWER